MNRRLLIPLVVFVVLAGFLFAGLWRDPREVPSPLIDKPAPTFTLAQLARATADARQRRHEGQGLAVQRLGIVVRLLPRGAPAARRAWRRKRSSPIIGLDYKDEPAAGMKWLSDNGDPYTTSVMDRDGRVGIDFGVYGVPETFVIDKTGTIRYKQIGPITQEALVKKILPLVSELQKS